MIMVPGAEYSATMADSAGIVSPLRYAGTNGWQPA